MAPGYWLICSFILMMGNVGWNTVEGQISWTAIYPDTSNRIDLWTVSAAGCLCPDRKSSNCACCVPGGCLCPSNSNKCAQCGLEDSCQRTCNVSISSRSVALRSGLSWVHLKSPELEGPTSCFWRLQSAPGQRIEVQIHRIISVGSWDNSTSSCKDGFLQFADGDTTIPSTQAIQLCGANSRFSPPVVLFGDQGMATLYLRIEGKSSRSQVLAYVSFSSADDPVVGFSSRGGRLRPHSVCDWTFDSCYKSECNLSSPGFPGLFPPHRRCRYFIFANSTTDKILIRFQSLNIPPPPLCSSHHIAVWRQNVSNLAHLGPPWKTLCQQSETTIEIEGGQALIEFRSGSTTSPNLYNGFRASVEFLHPPTIPPTNPPKRTPSTVEPKYKTTTTTIGRSLSTGAREITTNGIKPMDETARHPGELTEDINPTKPKVISCGHVFDGSKIREEGFRLKFPKEMLSSGGKKNSKKTPTQFHCRVEFLGKSTDIVQLDLSNYKLRGSNCSSQIEVYDGAETAEDEGVGNKTTVDRLSNKLCGPTSNKVRRFTSTHNRMAISVTIRQFLLHESPIVASEVLEGFFSFESIEGRPQPNCEVVFYGMTSPHLGSLVASVPSINSPLSRLSPLPSVCSYSLHPASNQSVLLTLLTTGHDTNTMTLDPHSKNYCRTVCSTSGCSCDSNGTPIEQVDHLSVFSGSAEIACFCGALLDVFPVVFESDNNLALITHYTSRKVLLNFNATYRYTTNKSRYTNFSIFPPNGWKRWREIIPGQMITPRGSHAFTVYDFNWPATIPNKFKLSIDLLSEENEQDCRAWNLTVWAEHSQFINRSYLLASFCPAEGRKEVKIPDSVRNATLILQGVSIRVPQFEVRWRYHDTPNTNRFPEKITSDLANKFFNGTPLKILVLLKLLFSLLLDSSYI